jgi:wobble nucleotide-excising tRNase
MIEKISRIKDFGVFADFRWPASLPGFKRFNLIYGWNYSGKTTLSRVFRCFENGQTHGDFAAGQAELKPANGGSTYSLASLPSAPVFRVFNSDFVQDNLQFETASASQIQVLGAEDIAKHATLKARTAELEALSSSVRENERKTREKKDAIQNDLTRFARDSIKNPLKKPNYDKTKFEPRVKECLNSQDSWLLDEGALERQSSIYHSTDKKPPPNPCGSGPNPVTPIREKASVVLERVVTASIPIPRLKDDPHLADWVRNGQPLHVGKSTCQFCDQPLPGVRSLYRT